MGEALGTSTSTQHVHDALLNLVGVYVSPAQIDAWTYGERVAALDWVKARLYSAVNGTDRPSPPEHVPGLFSAYKASDKYEMDKDRELCRRTVS